MELLLICVLMGRCVVIPLVFAFVHGPSDTWLAGLINSGATVIMGLVSLILILRNRLVSWKTPLTKEVIATLVASSHVFIGTFATSVYSTLNSIFLAGLTNPTEVGVFGLGDKIKTFFQTPITPWSSAVLPGVSREMARNSAAGIRLAIQILGLTAIGSFCLSIVLFASARTLIDVVAGPGYQRAVPVVRILACLPFIVGINTVLGLHFMLPLGLKRSFTNALVAGGGLNVGLLMLLEPHSGAVGAAGALVFTEVVVTLIMAILVFRHIARSPERTRQP
jgi:O-antigen/teichoic acid export membrane protein